MSLDQAIQAVRNFLFANCDRAFLVSEIAAALRPAAKDEAQVIGAVDYLAENGEAVSRLFAVSDPHLAFSSLRFVSGIGPAGSARQAELNTEKAYQAWLRQWLGSHRCS